jgi:hypothetical protein
VEVTCGVTVVDGAGEGLAIAEDDGVGLGAFPHATRPVAMATPRKLPLSLVRFPTGPCLHACAGQRR